MKREATILIVDDVPKNLQLLGTLLREHGYEVIFATNGHRALELARHEMPDLILLDVMMPGIDGFTVCRKLKESPETSDIPVLFITARTEKDQIVKGFLTGGLDYITKPFQDYELLARVQTHLKLRKRTQTLQKLNEILQEQLRVKTTLLKRKTTDHKNKSQGSSLEQVGIHAGGIAHDINNILTAILGYTEMIRLVAPDDPEVQTFTREIGKAGVRARHFLDQLRTFISDKEIIPVPVDMKKEVTDTIATMRGLCPPNLELVSCMDQTPVFVLADQTLIHRMVMNLLRNAIQAIGAEAGKVTLSVERCQNDRQEEMICLTVQDTGPGIPRDVIDHIFDMFWTSRKNQGGSGLGLTIVQDIVRRCGGTIQVESEPGDTRFHVFLKPYSPEKK